mgnify:CR=1 FL=1
MKEVALHDSGHDLEGLGPAGAHQAVEAQDLAAVDLSAFACVWVLDVERLDEPEIRSLEAYARRGGGVVFFTGPRTSDGREFTATVRKTAGVARETNEVVTQTRAQAESSGAVVESAVAAGIPATPSRTDCFPSRIEFPAKSDASSQ